MLTATRAEYSLLVPVVRAMQERPGMHPYMIVTGMHLSPEYGMTVNQIEADGIEIAARIPILVGGDSACATSKSMALATLGFADHFAARRPDCLVVLGDRFETLAVCCAAFNERIPIVHIHGGEKTEGAADDAYRHCITKLSQLHFTSTEEYRRRVIQLGEDPERVYNVGALGVENAANVALMSLQELSDSLNRPLKKPFVLMTYHPVTVDSEGAEKECRALLDAMGRFPALNYLATQANADAGGMIINQMLSEYADAHENMIFVKTLGMRRYLSAIHECAFVLGNSSSGILEVPSFHKPTVNIGNRQKGRIAGESVIHCGNDADSIAAAMERALSADFREKAARAVNPYEKPGTSAAIADRIESYFSMDGAHYLKSFYDL
ncbi:MAG: UDP-N-acetylglucosamine 2-epimerase [Clostridia bacterium]|nr:UDP-N-acetylglucosamine 2-epimerase [Clostridia bacterium]